MSRAARRRALRQKRKAAKSNTNAKAIDIGEARSNQTIKLENPVSHLYESFIAGNAQYCDKVVEPKSHEGQTVAICGAGPSLRENVERLEEADEVWGCNSAAIWLHDHGHPVTHGFTIDQTPAMLREWQKAPPLRYLLASTVHPYLTEHLLKHERNITWFHNFVGIRKPPVAYCECGHDEIDHIPVAERGKLGSYNDLGGLRVFDLHDGVTREDVRAALDEHSGACRECGLTPCHEYRETAMAYEDWLYNALYPTTVRAGSGLNAVSRAIDIAHFMGFSKILVLGADCALRIKRRLPEGILHGTPEHTKWLENDTEMHADGGNALASGATGVTLGGEVDGRHWETKPDLAITAVFLVKMKERLGDRLELIGDTLPNALVGKPDEFLARLPALTDMDGNPILPGAKDVPG